MKVDIMFITAGLYCGGKERQIIELIKCIKENNLTDLKFGILSLNSSQFYTDIAKKYFDLYLEIHRKNGTINLFHKTYYLIKKHKPKVIHTWDSFSSRYAYLPAKRMNIKWIDGSIRDCGVKKGISYLHRKLFLKRADLVISNSYAGLKSYKVEGKVIYNIIDLKRFHDKSQTKELNIIMVANFTKHKDHCTFIKAAIDLLEDNIVNKVYLIGDGPYLLSCQNHVKNIGSRFCEHILFIGKVSNIEDYLIKCDIGILCSTQKYGEGLSNSILEYMASKLVPIGSNVGAINEIIDDNLNGFIVEPGDHKSIYQKVKLLSNNRIMLHEFAQSAKERIRKRFESTTNARKYLKEYNQLIESIEDNETNQAIPK